jgi:polar amino acid transport system substrate-binding protein
MRSRLGKFTAVSGSALVATFLALAVAPSAMADMIGKCEVTGVKGSSPFTPAQPGQLTVEVNLPDPGWWNGDSPDEIQDGYEYCMAANIAYRAGLDKVKVVNVAWDALIAGQTKDFDLALAQISITEPRKKVVNFSIPYFDSDIGVLVKKGTPIDSESMKKMRIGVKQATTGADYVTNHLHPGELKVFPDDASLLTALMAGQVDAVIHDTAITLGHASQSNGVLEVAGQYSTGESYGALYPKNSPNAAIMDKIIGDLIKEGYLKKMASKYLAEAWGIDPTTVPFIKP